MAKAAARTGTQTGARRQLAPSARGTGMAGAALELRLGFLIHDISRLRRNAFDNLMKPLGVTRSQWWVLAHLSRHDGMMQTELATLLDVGKVTLGGLIDRLEAGGWVERRPDPVDRRVKRVYLTGNAESLLKDMRGAESRLNAEILKDVTPTQRQQLVDLMGAIKANLSRMAGSTNGVGDELE